MHSPQAGEDSRNRQLEVNNALDNLNVPLCDTHCRMIRDVSPIKALEFESRVESPCLQKSSFASTTIMTSQPTKQKLWGGRFTGKTDPLYAHTLSQILSIRN